MSFHSNPSITTLYPEYATTAHLDHLRSTAYSYLDAQSHTYLDYTGSGLCSSPQLVAHEVRLASTLYGNPHSVNPTSEAATLAVEQTRKRILQHFNADPAEYAVVFTPNATGAARLVGEGYQYKRGGRLVLSADNHNSVNGLREFAKRSRKGVKVAYVGIETTGPRGEMRIREEDVARQLPRHTGVRGGLRRVVQAGKKVLEVGKEVVTAPVRGCLDRFSSHQPISLPTTSEKRYHQRQQPAKNHMQESEHRNGLFAYPAQSNFTGVRHPLHWVPLAQSRGYDVLLDAAAYLPTSRLDLSGDVKPEFIIVSWYKLFGYPTGVGSLIVKRSALAKLRRPWFSGGTVKAVTVGVKWHQLSDRLEEAFEDGTVNFLCIPDVAAGLDWLDSRDNNPLSWSPASSPNGGEPERVEVYGIGGLEIVETRVRCLTGYFLSRLKNLRHSDGKPMVEVYGPTDTKMRGGSVAFNLLDARGQYVDERLVAFESAAARISLRTGCFCNPGAGEAAFGLDIGRSFLRLPVRKLWRMWRGYKREGRDNGEMSFEELLRVLGLPTAGGIRVSFGVASNVRDLEVFLGFVEKTYRDRVTTQEGLPERMGC
ncbi:pyridoxal phosphate-dependent transferase [Pseudoneurospora amorphoporcata]|uniref:Pyridoxal phosphate-dependent transferase n=1 Tax=Pseudoneurospora amorphoporcata TaxID=241081 RepID=A0AAN6NLQ9_9PEZI|nr:pyridoxal phosphate-dependent transferase [Pseudoneurospora amorphoporcata]